MMIIMMTVTKMTLIMKLMGDCVVYPIFKLDPFPDALVCPHARSCQLKGGLDEHRYQRLQAQFKNGLKEHRNISYQKHNSQTQGLLKGSLSTARDVKCE